MLGVKINYCIIIFFAISVGLYRKDINLVSNFLINIYSGLKGKRIDEYIVGVGDFHLKKY